MTRVLPVTTDGIVEAVNILRDGGLVVYPTETVYGLGSDAFNRNALNRLIVAKGRPDNMPFTTIVSDERMLLRLVARVPSCAVPLMQAYWPGPLTIVFPARLELPEPLVDSRGGMGIRISSDRIAMELVRAFGGPITATSANRSGSPAATSAVDAMDLGVEAILDGGIRTSLASTIVDVVEDKPILLRQGSVHLEF